MQGERLFHVIFQPVKTSKNKEIKTVLSCNTDQQGS